MTTMTTALHDCAVMTVEAYDIDALNWNDDSVTSFDPTVLKAAQQTITEYSREERVKLRMGSNKQSSLTHADVADRLCRLGVTTVESGLIAALIIEMHRTVTL